MSNAASNTQTPQRFSGEWETKQLKELGQFSKGRGIKRDDVSDEGLPCVRYGELYTRYQDYILKIASRIPPSVAATALPIKKGDLLFAGSGETAEEIGRCAAYLGEEQAYAGGDVIVLTPSGQNPIYLGHLMNSAIVSAQKARMGQGDAVVHIYINNLAQVQVELPPITEQNAIAETLSDMDGLLNALDALIAKKRAIKQAAMQQLLTGKTRLSGFSGAWETKRLGEITKIQKGSLITEKSVVPGPIPVIAGGQKPPYYHNTANRTGKTITVSGSGAYAGFVAFHSQPIFASDCSTISENSSFSIDFIYYFLVFNQEVIYKAQTGGAQPHIHPVDLMPLEVNLPELSEQKAIASVLSDMDSEIAALEQRRDKTHAIKQGMMQQLLTGRVRLSESRIIADDTDDAD
ncbi:MAG: restriction endonuclease subunit S [Candidatus Poribacteria bacterium]|nr:restriction endonuclease subunit S [Candidatus Poribacteria bacterium]